MLSTEQRRQVLHTLRTNHPDGRFSVADAVRAAGPAPGANEDDVRTVLKTWQWRSIVAPAQPGVYRFRRTGLPGAQETPFPDAPESDRTP